MFIYLEQSLLRNKNRKISKEITQHKKILYKKIYEWALLMGYTDIIHA